MRLLFLTTLHKTVNKNQITFNKFNSKSKKELQWNSKTKYPRFQYYRQLMATRELPQDERFKDPSVRINRYLNI